MEFNHGRLHTAFIRGLLYALILSILVSVGAPRIKYMDVVRIYYGVRSAAPQTAIRGARLGAWGYCNDSLNGTICISSKPAYNFTIGITNATLTANRVISSQWTRGLVLHTPATAMLFLTFLAAFRTDLFGFLFAQILSALSFMLTCAAFSADLALVEYVKRRVKKLGQPRASVKPGPVLFIAIALIVLQAIINVAMAFQRVKLRRLAQSGTDAKSEQLPDSALRYSKLQTAFIRGLLYTLILSTLAAIGLPYIKSLDIVRINFSTPASTPSALRGARLGAWGFCFDSADDHSCTLPRHAYSFTLKGGSTVPDTTNVISAQWTRGLIIHTPATFAVFYALLSSFQKDVFGLLVTHALSVVALALTVMAFCANLALLGHAKRQVKKLNLPASVKPGPAFYISMCLVLMQLAITLAIMSHRRRQTGDGTDAPSSDNDQNSGNSQDDDDDKGQLYNDVFDEEHALAAYASHMAGHAYDAHSTERVDGAHTIERVDSTHTTERANARPRFKLPKKLPKLALRFRRRKPQPETNEMREVQPTPQGEPNPLNRSPKNMRDADDFLSFSDTSGSDYGSWDDERELTKPSSPIPPPSPTKPERPRPAKLRRKKSRS